MKNIYSSLLITLSFLFSTNTNAQTKEVAHQELVWIRYYNQLSLNSRLTWHNEFDERRFFDNNKHQQFILHTRLHYKFIPNADIAAGFCYSLQSPQFPSSTSDLIIPEYRPEQEVNYTSKISDRFGIQHRIRVDERFIQKNSGKELLEGFDFNFRFRYRLQLSYNLGKEVAKNLSVVKLSDEIMMNAGSHILYNQLDQNRIYLGFEQGINKYFSAEIGYIYWYQQRTSGYQFFERDILRFTLYHKIRL